VATVRFVAIGFCLPRDCDQFSLILSSTVELLLPVSHVCYIAYVMCYGSDNFKVMPET